MDKSCPCGRDKNWQEKAFCKTHCRKLRVRASLAIADNTAAGRILPLPVVDFITVPFSDG
jgi:hypothetical protein